MKTMKYKTIALFVIFLFSIFSVKSQNPKHIKIRDGKMIFHKIYYVASLPNSIKEKEYKNTSQKYSYGEYIEIYAECPLGVKSQDDFQFIANTFGLLSLFRNDKKAPRFELFGVTNEWDIKDKDKQFLLQYSYSGKIDIIFTSDKIKLQVYTPAGEGISEAVLKQVWDVEMALDKFDNFFTSYYMFGQHSWPFL